MPVPYFEITNNLTQASGFFVVVETVRTSFLYENPHGFQASEFGYHMTQASELFCRGQSEPCSLFASMKKWVRR